MGTAQTMNFLQMSFKDAQHTRIWQECWTGIILVYIRTSHKNAHNMAAHRFILQTACCLHEVPYSRKLGEIYHMWHFSLHFSSVHFFPCANVNLSYFCMVCDEFGAFSKSLFAMWISPPNKWSEIAEKISYFFYLSINVTPAKPCHQNFPEIKTGGANAHKRYVEIN